MSSLSIIRFLVCALGVVAACIFTGVHGRTLQVNWTAEGVRNYTSTPLKVELGDSLFLLCENISNLFILTDQIQYDSCNASAGSGLFVYNGFCIPGSSVTLTLTENSQNLRNTVNFMNNQAYFLTSYSDGRHILNDDNFTSGGQCEDGVKMIILIGDSEVEVLTSESDVSVHTHAQEVMITDLSTTNRLTTDEVMITSILTSMVNVGGTDSQLQQFQSISSKLHQITIVVYVSLLFLAILTVILLLFSITALVVYCKFRQTTLESKTRSTCHAYNQPESVYEDTLDGNYKADTKSIEMKTKVV